MATAQPMVVNNRSVMSRVMLAGMVMMQSLWDWAERMPQLVVVAESSAPMARSVGRMRPPVLREGMVMTRNGAPVTHVRQALLLPVVMIGRRVGRIHWERRRFRRQRRR